MPHIAVASVLLNTVYNSLYCINLVWAHNEQFLFTFNQNHILADHFTKRAFGQKFFSKSFYMGDFLIVLVCQLINRQKLLFCIESKVLIFIVGKIVGVGSVTNNK